MAEIEIVRIPVAASNEQSLVDLLRSGRTGYFSAPDCRGLEVARAEGHVVAIVLWASAGAHARAAARPSAHELLAQVSRLAANPPSIETLDAPNSGVLSGQVALISGGGKGIGRSVVDAYVAEGALVAVADIDTDSLRVVSDDHGDFVLPIEADLSTVAGATWAVERTVARYGRLDILVANAGIFDGFFEFADIDIAALDGGFDKVFDANVRGMILLSRAALPHLVRSEGTIIATLSNASLHPDGGGVLYIASKHACLGVVRQLAHELAPVVRVNAVAPGATRSAIGVPDVLGGPLDQTAPEISAAISEAVPLGVHVEPAAHAAAYVLLASKAQSGAMTGTVIESDGGLGVRGLRRVRGGAGLADRFFGERA